MSSLALSSGKSSTLSLIGVLLIPLALAEPSGHQRRPRRAGQPRRRAGPACGNNYHLSQAQLGEIDPGSVTIKLATLGMRGVAANILWEKATDYKMRKDWTNFGATLNQITKVQPNFINVWTNQAWNLSYNVSVEFDDYRERYRWVIKGFKFLDEGIKYNEDQPRLAVGDGPDGLAENRQGRRGQTVPPALRRRHRLPRFAAAGHARHLLRLPRPPRQLAGRQGLVREGGRDDR